jgi:hypothetical protein
MNVKGIRNTLDRKDANDTRNDFVVCSTNAAFHTTVELEEREEAPFRRARKAIFVHFIIETTLFA